MILRKKRSLGERERERRKGKRESERNIRKVKIKNKGNIECWLGLREIEPHMHCWWNTRWYSHSGKQFGGSFVIVQSPSQVWLCDPMDCMEFMHARPPCPSPPPRVCPSSHSLHQWCRPAITSSDALFSYCLQSFPAPGTFPMSRLFTSDDQNTGASASASVLPVNIQGWSPLRLTGLISWLSEGLSGVFSRTTAQKHHFFGILPSLWSSSYNCMWPLGRP